MHTVIVISTGKTGTVDVGNGFFIDGSGTENGLCPKNAKCFWEGELKISGIVRHIDETWKFEDGNHHQPTTFSFTSKDGATIWLRNIHMISHNDLGAIVYAVETAPSKTKRTCFVCGKPAEVACSCCDRCYVYCSNKCAERNWISSNGMHVEALRASEMELPRETSVLPLYMFVRPR